MEEKRRLLRNRGTQDLRPVCLPVEPEPKQQGRPAELGDLGI